MVMSEIITKHGEELAQDITERKLNDPELRATEVRQHPEMDEKKKVGSAIHQESQRGGVWSLMVSG